MAATKVLSFDGERELVTEPRAHALLGPYADALTAPDVPLFTHITLCNKSYTLGAAQVIASFFSTLLTRGAFAQLTSVDFADMIAGRPEDEALQVLATLCDALQGLKTLTHIDLSDNALGEKGVRACFGLLLAQEELTHVYFCNNGISAAAAQVIADDVLLFRGADAPTKLETFHFYNNMSGDGGAEALARLLPRCPRLTDLRFSATRAQRKGSLAFAKALASLTQLKKIDLSDNTFKGEGGAAIAVALAQLPHLHELNLRDAAIEDDGMTAIATTLRCVPQLTALDVSSNDLTAESVRVLAANLHHVPQLRVLQLEENEFGSAGARALAKALRKAAPTLETLVVNVNEIGASGAVALAAAVAGKATLMKLEMDGNMIARDGVDKLTALLAAKGKADVLGSLEDNDEDGEEDEEGEEEEEEEEGTEVVSPPPAPVDELAALLDKSLSIAEPLFAFKSTQREVVDAARARALLIEAGVDPAVSSPLAFTAITLRGKSYTDDGARVLASALLSRLAKPQLRVVDLADVIAGRPEDEALRVLATLCGALAGHTLDEIDLSDNALGEKGVRACFALLIPQPSLRRLLFCNNGISAAAAQVIAQEIVLQNGPQAPSPLYEFHFYNNMSGHDGAVAIANVLPQCPSLTVFRFASARAGLEASEVLARSVAQHLRLLASLDLSDCSFEDGGVDALADAVAQQSSLRVLKLRDASLGAQGATRVVQAAVDKVLPLVSLDLSGNELEDKGLAKLLPLLAKLAPTLRTLRLDENELTSSGVAAFAKQLATLLPSLEELSLCGNEITARGAVVLAGALPTSIVRLDVDANQISDKGVTQMKELLAQRGQSHVLGSLQENDGDDESDDDE